GYRLKTEWAWFTLVCFWATGPLGPQDDRKKSRIIAIAPPCGGRNSLPRNSRASSYATNRCPTLTGYLNAYGWMHFFQSRAYGRDTVRGVARGQKPAKNHKNDAYCRKKRMLFGGHSDVLCIRTNVCIGCNGPSQSRFSARRRRAASKNHLTPISTVLYG